VNPLEILGLVFILLCIGLIIIFSVLDQGRIRNNLREISAYTLLKRAIGLSVEAGNRLHFSIGRGNLTGQQSAVTFVGLNVLEQISRAASFGDRPPVVTSGDGSLAILIQDNLQRSARSMDSTFDPTAGRLSGLTPFSFAAGALSVIHDDDVGANVLIGSFGSEAALITEAGERTGSLIIAGTDNLPGQAILYASSQEPLIGEDVYAGGAYLESGRMHLAGIKLQDILRWVIIFIIAGGAIAKLLGVI
jgi:hypothetical protein